MKKIKYFVEFIIIIFFLMILKILGLKISRFISSFIFKLIGPLFRAKRISYNNLSIVLPDIKINVDYLWESWICLRSKSIYNDTLAMNIKNIDDMTEEAIWEYKKGSKIKRLSLSGGNIR